MLIRAGGRASAGGEAPSRPKRGDDLCSPRPEGWPRLFTGEIVRDGMGVQNPRSLTRKLFKSSRDLESCEERQEVLPCSYMRLVLV
jgi:hypothetical protein